MFQLAVSEINDGALSFTLSVPVWWLCVVRCRSVLGSVVWFFVLIVILRSIMRQSQQEMVVTD